MADDNNSTILSKTLIDNADASAMRDPFVKAQQQYQDRMGQGSVLSSSPVQAPPQQGSQEPNASLSAKSLLFNPSNQQDFQDFSSSPFPKQLQKMGINDKGLALNDVGRLQLIGRLQDKFGASYSDSPEVMKMLQDFEQAMKSNKAKTTDNTQVSNAQRTLAALLGG